MKLSQGPVQLLIVDDSDFSRQTISQMLKDSPYKIIGEVASAKDAMSVLQERKVDIAIIDIVMPEISGLELADLINKSFSQTSIIMISSLAQESIVIEAISVGANDFLQKPFLKEDLISSIEKIIQNGGLA